MLNASPSSFIIMPALAKIVCEPGWKWQNAKGPCRTTICSMYGAAKARSSLMTSPLPWEKEALLFRPGDHTSATHNPQKPLVLTYIHFDVTDPVQEIPASYRKLTETMDFEYLLARYVRLYLDKPYGSLEEALILKQLMIHLSRADLAEPVVKKQAISCPRRSMKSRITYASTRVFPIGSRIWRPERDCPRYFSIKFKELIGTPVQSYIIQMRIERARISAASGMNVTEVADALGYRDIFFSAGNLSSIRARAHPRFGDFPPFHNLPGGSKGKWVS